MNLPFVMPVPAMVAQAPAGAPNREFAIPATLSVYLDLVRSSAAVFVVLYHSWAIVYPDSKIRWLGHEAVIVFFVLSGYVIAHAATGPGETVWTYIQHRMARILPVAYLALGFGLALSPYLAPAGQVHTHWWLSLANMLLVAQSGWMFLEAPAHAPYWSLNYEVWYYIIFGTWLFAPRKWRNVVTAVVMLAAGPKILMLSDMVIRRSALPQDAGDRQASGAGGLHRHAANWRNVYVDRPVKPEPQCALRRISADVACALFHTVHLRHPARRGGVLQFCGSERACALSALPGQTGRAGTRTLAGYTFSLYLFHSSLIELMTKVLHITRRELFYALMAVCVVLLGQLTENAPPFSAHC